MQGKRHPAEWTYANIAGDARATEIPWVFRSTGRARSRLRSRYYGRQQQLFLDFLKAGIVVRKQSKVNWDPVDHTVLPMSR